MDFWKVLGIEPTEDKDIIQDAYYSLLNIYHPEEDPEGFQNLRNAYQMAMEYNTNEDDEEDSDVTAFMDCVEELYRDYHKRIDPENWIALLNDDICIQIDMSEIISEKLLIFFMDNYYMPHVVWKVLDDFFKWSEKKEELYKKFARNFIDFIQAYSKKELYLRYDAFDEYAIVDYDEFIRLYNKACFEIRNTNIYAAQNSIEEASKIYDNHPDLTILKVKYEYLNNRMHKVISMCDDILTENKEEAEAHTLKADALMRCGELEDAYDEYKKAYDINPNLVSNIYDIGFISLKTDRIKEAKEYLYSLKEDPSFSNKSWNLVQDINEMIKDHEFSQLLDDLSQSPLDLDINVKISDYYYDEDHPEKCYDFLKDLETKTKLNDNLYLTLAKCAIDLKKNKEAIVYYDKAIDTSTDKATAYGLKATALHDMKKYDEALLLYDKAIDLSEEKYLLLNNKAHLLGLMERYEESLKCCNDAIAMNGDFPYLYNNRASALFYLGDYDEALDDCDTAIAIFPYFPGPYKNKAKVYIRTERYNEALNVCETAFKLQQYEASIYYCKAEALYYLDKKDQAEKLCLTALEKDKEYDEAYYLLGEMHYHEKDFKTALKYYSKAVHCNPRKGYYHVCMADTYKALKQTDKAINSYSQSIRLIPKYTYAVIERAKLYKMQKRFEKAIKDLEGILKYDENNTYCYNELGEIYEDYNSSKDSNEMSLAYYTKALEIDPEYAYCYVNRGLYYSNLKEYEKSILDYTSAIDIDPEYIYAINNRGISYMRLDRYDEAMVDFRRAIEVDAKFYYGYNNIGECLCSMEREEEGIEYYTKAIETNPEYMYGYLNRGLANYDLKKYKSAIEDFSFIIDEDHADYRTITSAYEGRAKSYAALNMTEEAIADYQQCIDRNPNNKYIEEEITKLKKKNKKQSIIGRIARFIKK